MQQNGEKKIIGLILDEIISEFSKELIQSVVNAIPADSNIRLVVIAGKYIPGEEEYDENRAYKLVYNSIFRLGELSEIDGLIIHLGSLSDDKVHEIRDTFSERFHQIPKVRIASNRPNITTINYDNEAGIREAVGCLVNVNGLTKFCMLGGRDDNVDACARRAIFERCLKSVGISFTEENYARTNMSDACVEEAGELLDRNPGVQAIFCVNDAAAKGLYEAMKLRGLTPGRDILVFGFDNTHMAGELTPTLSSIGADRCTLGQRALEVLMRKLSGETVTSALVPTRLYGRESLQYESYVYTRQDMQNLDAAFIDRMFDDCFYRYKNEFIDRESVDLRRLFREFMTALLKAMQRRYLSFEEYTDIADMIGRFFEKGAMEYTDAVKLVKSLGRLQEEINSLQRSPAVRIVINRLLSGMRDRAICALADQKFREGTAFTEARHRMQAFVISGMDYANAGRASLDNILRNLELLGLHNAAVYTYESPVRYEGAEKTAFPDEVSLKCVIKSDELYMLPPERQRCQMAHIFRRDELSRKTKGFASFTIFYGSLIYGFLLCEITPDIYDRGENIAVQLGKSMYLCDMQKRCDELCGEPAI